MLRRSSLFLCIFLLFVSFYCRAQTPQRILDSLLAVDANHIKSDTIKSKNLFLIMRQYFRMKNPQKGLEYRDKTIALATTIKDKPRVGWAYNWTARYYHGRDYISAITNYNKAIDYCLQNKLDYVATNAYLNLGALYMAMPDYGKSLEAHQSALEISLKHNYTDIIPSCYANIAEIYSDLNQLDKAFEYNQKCLKLFLAEGKDSRGVVSTYISMADIYKNGNDQVLKNIGIAPENKLDEALKLLKFCETASSITEDDEFYGLIRQNIGEIYALKNEDDKALAYYLNAIKYNSQQQDQSSLVGNYLLLGDFFMAKKDYEKSIGYYKDALEVSKKSASLATQREALAKLSQAYEKENDYTTSLSYYKEFIKVRDNIFNEDKEKEITRRQLQIDFNIKEKDYQFTQQFTSENLKQQVLLASQRQQQLQLNQQQLLLAQQEKSIQRLDFLKKQAELVNQQTLQKNNFQTKELKSAFEKSLQAETISNQRDQIIQDGRFKVYMVIALILLCVIAFLIFQSHHKATKFNKIITHQKLALEQLGGVKDRIFSVVSHDMRTPVNALLSFTQLLEDGNINQDKLKLYAAELKGQLTHTSAMMENVLNWAASQMQGFNPIMEQLDLKELVDETIAGLYPQANKKQITIKEDVAVDALAYADRNMVSLIVRNLISNAIKFTPSNGEIRISSSVIEDAVRIYVSDNGTGIEASLVHQFNSPGFLQAEKRQLGTHREKGTGLGLMLCKSFMRMLKGDIHLESELGKGSKFILTLPV